MSDRQEDQRNEDDISLRGMGNDVKGRLKDAAGGLTGDTSMQAEGKWDRLKGKAQRAIGDARREMDRESDLDEDRDRDI